jgi:hypothetical protein
VPLSRPVSPAETLVALEPEPTLTAVVFEPYEVDFPYSTYQVVAWPAGFTLPVTVALVGPTAVVGPVVADGPAATALAVTRRPRISASVPAKLALRTLQSFPPAHGGSAGAA